MEPGPEDPSLVPDFCDADPMEHSTVGEPVPDIRPEDSAVTKAELEKRWVESEDGQDRLWKKQMLIDPRDKDAHNRLVAQRKAEREEAERKKGIVPIKQECV